MMAHLDDTWFYDQLKNNRPLKTAHEAFRVVHGERKSPFLTLEVFERHNDSGQIETCRETLERLDSIVPLELAEVVRYTAVVYANFCDEIFAGLDTLYFQSILMEWFLHSESSLKGKRYRDHLTHQLKVCLLGLGLIDGTLLGKELGSHIVSKLGNNKMIARYLDGEGLEPKDINNETVLAAWFISSLFHDLGYCFLAYVKTASQLHKVSDFFETDFETTIWKKVEPRIYDHSYIVSFYRKYGAGLDNHSPLQEVKELIRRSAFWSPNHSVIGALNLHYILSRLEEDASSAFSNQEGAALKKRLRLIFELASLAILTHDIDSPKKRIMVDPAEKKKSKRAEAPPELPLMKNSFRILFDEAPLSYLLGVCDQLQEWGRVRVDRTSIDKSTGKSIEENRCTDSYLVDCEAIKLSLSNNTLNFTTILSEDNSSNPSFQILGIDISKDLRDKVTNRSELLERYPEGRLSILNSVYGSCPLWDQIEVMVDAHGSKVSPENYIDPK